MKMEAVMAVGFYEVTSEHVVVIDGAAGQRRGGGAASFTCKRDFRDLLGSDHLTALLLHLLVLLQHTCDRVDDSVPQNPPAPPHAPALEKDVAPHCGAIAIVIAIVIIIAIAAIAAIVAIVAALAPSKINV